MKIVASPLFAPIWLFAAVGSLAASGDPSATVPSSSPSGFGSLREAYVAAQQAFVTGESGQHAARNLSQRWRANFDGRGFTATPDDADWKWGLELRGYGFSGAERAVDAVQGRAGAGRLSYQRDESLEEWFVNDGRGLEQGWTLQARPAGPANASRLLLNLAVRGSLQAAVSEQSVQFTDESGTPRVTYSGLKAWDAEGRILPARFAKADEGFSVEIDERNARYPITIDPIAQQAYLKASNTGANDEFGTAVAIDGNVAVVGAPKEDSNAITVNGDGTNDLAADSGAAYVFVRTGKLWNQQAYLKASNSAAGDEFGTSVAVSGNTVVVGAPQQGGSGAAYVFVRSGWVWTQQAMLKASNAESGDKFGNSVSISGTSILVGAPDEDSSATLVGGNQLDNGASNSGAAYVFTRVSTRTGVTWPQQAYIKASNTGNGDWFGWSVSISGDRALIGAYWEASDSDVIDAGEGDNSAPDAGAAYIYRREGTVWIKEAYLKASNSDASDNFGWSVSISGDLAVVGAVFEAGDGSDPSDDSLAAAGAAYVFGRKGTKWVQEAYLKSPSGPQSNGRFGFSVAVSGVTLAVGEHFRSAQEGSVYVFTRPGSNWSPDAPLAPLGGSGGGQFGCAVGVTAGTVIAGARFEDSSTTGINGNPAPVITLANSGSAYVFDGAWPFYPSFAKGSHSAPGASNIAFSRPLSTAISDSGTVMYGHSLTGTGAASGRGSAMFSTLGGTGASDLLLQLGDDLSGFGDGYLPGIRVTSVSDPILHENVQGGVFQALVSGPGITTLNNRAILRDDGSYLRLVRRTGRPISELGNASASTFVEVLHSMNSDLTTVSHRLRVATVPTVVTATNDSGILPLDANGGLFSSTPPREGQAAYGDVAGNFGQFNGIASARGVRIHFTAALLPTPSGVAKQAVFFTDATTTTTGRSALQGDPAWNASPALFGTFPAVGEANDKAVFRATLTGVATTLNEGVFSADGNIKLLQKGVVFDPVNFPNLVVSRFVRVWPVGVDQAVFHVVLAGPGLTSTNNVALLLRQSDGTFLSLLRTNDVAPGVGLHAARIAAIQAVDVNPINGHYAILASLRGVASTSNQALWAGTTSLGDNTANNRILRLPVLRLRKGDTYKSERTPRDVIRAINLRTPAERTGISGRGLGQSVGINGQILIGVVADRSQEELLMITQ